MEGAGAVLACVDVDVDELVLQSHPPEAMTPLPTPTLSILGYEHKFTYQPPPPETDSTEPTPSEPRIHLIDS